MNELGWTILWCAVQVSLFLVAGAAVYLLARRRGPVVGSAAALATLLLVLAVSVAGFTSWPRWWAVPAELVSAFSETESPDRFAVQTPLPAATSPSLLDNLLADGTDDGEQASAEVPDAAPRLNSPREFEPGESSSPSGTVLRFVVLLLPLGALLMLVRLSIGIIAVSRCRNRSTPVEDQRATEILTKLRSHIQDAHNVELRESAAIAAPATVGWRRPAILLPSGWRDWSGDQLRAVLAHELAHIARGDYGAWLAVQTTRVLHFYHPLVHWLAARLRLEQELAADEWAAEHAGGRKRYLAALAELALSADERPIPWPARTFMPGRGTLMRRIDMLRFNKKTVDVTSTSSFPLARTAVGGALLAAAIIAAGLRGPFDASSAEAAANGSAPAAKQVAANTLQEVRHFEKGGTVYSVAFSSDSRVAIVGGNFHDWPVRFYDIDTGKELGHIDAPRRAAIFITVSPNQRHLATLGIFGAPMLLFNLETTELVHTLPHPLVALSLDFSPDSRTLASPGPNETLRLWDVESGVEVRSIPGQSTRLYSVDFSPNGQWIASGGTDKIARICDVSSGNGLVKLEHPDVVWCVAFSPDGRFLATGTGGDLLNMVQERYARGGDNRLRLWDAATGRLIREFEGHTHAIRGLAFTPDGTRVLTASLDGTLRLWDLIGGSELARIESKTWVIDVAVSPDGQYALASGGALRNDVGTWIEVPEERLRLFRLHRSQLPRRRNAAAVSAAVSEAQQPSALAARRQQAAAAAHEVSMRKRSMNNLHKIGVALHNYAAAVGHFPTVANYDKDGKPLLSWRVHILPYLEIGDRRGGALYKQFHFDEPWDSEHNKKLLAKMPEAYRFPGEPKTTTHTAYLAVSGKETVFPPEKGVRFQEIIDGTSQTMMLVEVKSDIPIQWTEPIDTDFDFKGDTPKLGGYLEGGFNSVFADGAVHFISDAVDPELIKKLVTKAGKEVFTLEESNALDH